MHRAKLLKGEVKVVDMERVRHVAPIRRGPELTCGLGKRFAPIET
jgi:hypothetical protein